MSQSEFSQLLSVLKCLNNGHIDTAKTLLADTEDGERLEWIRLLTRLVELLS